MNNTPEVRISFAPMLKNMQIITRAEDQANSKILDWDEGEEKAEQYRQAWKEKAEIILPAMQELLGVTFYRPVIDAAVAPWTIGVGISNPLILDFRADPDEFIDSLTHELFHILFVDNNVMTAMGAKSQNRLKMDELFGSEHSDSTQVHIAVHAGLKCIYLDILQEPYRLDRDIKYCDQFEDYKKAWEYVQQNDYMEIIGKLKDRYTQLRDV